MTITPLASRLSARARITVPAAQAPAVAAVATCDGSGLIVVPTEDGPDRWACTGCRACTTPVEAPSRHAARLAADPFHSLPVADDEVW